jgi:copper transport protein
VTLARSWPAVVAVVCAAWFGCAWPHAALLEASPPDGARLATPPGVLVLRFDEPVGPLAMRLVDAQGATVATGEARAEGNLVRVPVPAHLPAGAYVFSWRVASADAHPVGGSLAFSVGAVPPDAAVPLGAQASGATGAGDAAASAGGAGDSARRASPLAAAVRAVRDFALLVTVGLAAFALVVVPGPGPAPGLAASGAVTAVFALAGFVAQAIVLSGGALDAAALVLAARSTAASSAVLVAAGGLAAVASARAAQSRPRALLLTLAVVAPPLGAALTGHPRAAGSAWAAVVAAHVLAAGFWAGSLVALACLLRRADAAAPAALQRFSALAPVAVTALLAAGFAFAARQLDAPRDLIDTSYGRLVLAKATVLAMLLAIAARNRYRLVPAFERGSAAALPALRRAVGLEIALVAVAAACTAVLSGTAPGARGPRIATARESAERVIPLGEGGGTLAVAPARPGRNVVTVVLRDREGHPLDAVEARLRIANPGAGLEPLERTLQRTGPGTWRHTGDELRFAGTWTLEVKARVDDFHEVDAQATLTLH